MVKIRSLLNNLTVAVSLVGVLPVYLYLDRPTQVLFPAALLIGAWSDRRESYVISAKAATILSILVFTVFALQINKNYLVEPALNIAVLLLAVRLVTEKEGRHFLQIFLLSGFALAGSSLVTLSLAFLPLMILLVSGIIFGLILLCFYSDDPRLTLDRAGFIKLVKMSLILPTGALLLAVFFFFILPRTQHPLWDFLNPGGAAKVGFSEEVRPGSYAATVADDTIAFRVEAPEMDPNELYWRVTVLDTLEGSVWKRAYRASSGHPAVTGGRIVNITVYPEAGQGRFLATLDTPESIHGVYNKRRTDGVFRYYRTAKRPQSYEVKARLNGQIHSDRRLNPEIYLQIPDGIAPVARAKARSLVSSKTINKSAAIEIIKDFFRNQQLVYATDNLPTEGDPVDTFLFDSKRGYCEYFASAMAIMLRTVDVPTRLVGGYLGGQFNEIGGYYTVGERTAHVWVEALTEEGVWERIDPNLYAVNVEESLLSRSRIRPLGWRQVADAIDYYWTQAVITFDFARQLEFAKSARDTYRDWRRGKSSFQLSAWIIIIPLLPILLIFLLRRESRSVEEKLLQRFTRIIRQQVGSGQIPPAIGLHEMARRCPGASAQEFVRIYSGAIYRDRSLSKNEIRELRRLLGEMGKAV